MIVKQVPHNSKDYWELVRLRDEILRKPLHLKFTDAELMAEGEQIHFGIFQDHEALACMVLVAQEHGKMKMRQVCVSAQAQGQKLGKRLLQHCEDFAKKEGYTIMHCHARDTAKNFYLSQGYAIEGKVFQEVGIDHYYMWKGI